MWSEAVATFGEGIPNEGAEFDQSSRLQELQDTVRSADPGEGWRGPASDSYAEANTRQADTLSSLGSLDRRLAVEVDRSAAVVSAGRRDLDTVRKFVDDAVERIPNTAAGEQMLYPVISKGSSDIQDIINRSHDDLSAIAERVRGLGVEYEALGDGA